MWLAVVEKLEFPARDRMGIGLSDEGTHKPTSPTAIIAVAATVHRVI
jgi:hypothetical protein